MILKSNTIFGFGSIKRRQVNNIIIYNNVINENTQSRDRINFSDFRLRCNDDAVIAP